VANYYRAADAYLHAAKADTFPSVVLEALACGTPVVATAVGGIPEQVRLGETGELTPGGDAQAMGEAVVRLLNDETMRRRMGERAADDAAARFSLDRQVRAYLDWFACIVECERSTRAIGSSHEFKRRAA
jgi:glycosyltransferase involved in cell wall biosynthesis